MPNWCNNTIEISGSKKNMKPIYDFLSKHEDKEHRADMVMNTLIPHDEEYLQIQESGQFLINPQTEFYGTKWDFQLGEACVNDCSPKFITMSPSTAWSPPIEFCSKLAKKYGVKVKIMYSESGNNFSGYADIDTDGEVDDNQFDYLEGIYLHFDEEEFWNEIDYYLDIDIEDYETGEGFANQFPFVNPDDRQEIINKFTEAKSNLV